MTISIDSPLYSSPDDHESRLLELHTRLLTAKQIAGIGHWYIDARTRERVWSTELRRIFGLGPQDSIPKFDAEMNGYHPADREQIRAAVFAALRSGGDVNVTARIVQHSGEVRHVVIRGVSEGSADGFVEGLFGICIDVTDVRETEYKFRISESRLRTFVDNVTDCGIFVLSSDGIVSDWNTGAERICGYDWNDVVGRSFSVFFTSEDRARGAPAAALAGARLNGIHVGEGWWVRKDRSRFRSSSILSAMRDEKGILTGFTNITRDITERVRIEEELREKTELLDLIVNNMDQGLILVDAVDVVKTINTRASSLLNLPIALLSSQPTLSRLLRHQCEQEHSSTCEPESTCRTGLGTTHHDFSIDECDRRNGNVLEVRTMPLTGGGSVRMLTDITMRRRAELRAEHLATHDALTGLPNRRGFGDRLTSKLVEIVERGGACAVLRLDLDRFKAVSDSFGHSLGDRLLKTVVERIQSVLDIKDFVSRVGGNEFAIVVELDPGRSVDLVARAVVDVVSAPCILNGLNINIGTNIGVSVAPGDGSDSEKLLRNADLALDMAKSAGRNNYQCYDPVRDGMREDRLLLEIALAQAVRQHQFEMHYQPILDVRSGQFSGFEALIRWRHPHRGLIAPGVFITLAEETGLIVPIGQWALLEACRTAADWPADLRIAVNVSAIQFRQIGFEQSVRFALLETGLLPERLELEITESAFMQDGDEAFACLARLREMGVRIALDDFGTGYSSLSYLHRFPIDKIKIDKAFVQRIGEPHADDIVRAIVTLGKIRGNYLTAEGVETEEQFDWIASIGCDQIQGYLIGRPEPANIARKLAHKAR